MPREESREKPQPDGGGEVKEVVYKTDDEREHKSALNELLFKENTHVTDVLFWTAGVAMTTWAAGYVYAMKDVVDRTPATWSELMSSLPVSTPAAFGVMGALVFVLFAGIALLHSLEEDDEDD